MLRIDDEQEQNQLECLHCVYKQSNKQYLPLDLIIDSNEQTIFKGWPVFDDSQIYENLLEATQQVSYKEENIQEVKVYFKELKAKVFELIEQKESELLQIVEQNSNSNVTILEEYNSLSQKERLRNIILNNFQDLESQDKMLKDLIKENKLNQERNKASIEDILNTQKLFKIDMTIYNEIKDNIIEIISNINQNLENNLEDLPNCKNFENIKINLKGNKITDSFLSDIEKSLENHKVEKLSLNLAQNHITGQGAISIKNIVERLPSISNLRALHIAKAIQNCNNITRLNLNLYYNDIESQGTNYFSSALEQLKNIVWLKINTSENQIGDEGIKQISNALENFQEITNINIGFRSNSIKDVGVNIIVSSLQKCKKITNLNLDLRENNISQIAKSNLKKVFESQKLSLQLKI
ncbi:hypothetical protein ABPG72_019014 [Tetrahymena utriculariae]